ncbi:MAG: hypothetical protein KG003_13895 [Bacteroidetes bacterium]|nr:hypothetical protein [Bacteroidota bacterium]
MLPGFLFQVENLFSQDTYLKILMSAGFLFFGAFLKWLFDRKTRQKTAVEIEKTQADIHRSETTLLIEVQNEMALWVKNCQLIAREALQLDEANHQYRRTLKDVREILSHSEGNHNSINEMSAVIERALENDCHDHRADFLELIKAQKTSEKFLKMAIAEIAKHNLTGGDQKSGIV